MRAIDVSIPEGYEYSHMAEPVLSNGGGILQVVLKKKNNKDFAFYVDEYLRSDYNTTNDMLCNWFDKDQLEKIGNNLKQNKLQFVPWEVKIGLLKFIYNDAYPHSEESFAKVPIKTIVQYERMMQICPSKFLSIFKL